MSSTKRNTGFPCNLSNLPDVLKICCVSCALYKQDKVYLSTYAAVFLGAMLLHKDMHLGRVNVWHFCAAAGCCSADTIST